MTTKLTPWVLVAVLVVGSGCAKSDWIQQTLVTVDVTGAWQGPGGNFELALEQHGPKVTGSMVWRAGVLGRLAGAIEGNIAGDVLRFKQTSGTDPRVFGEMTVNGDEMTGALETVSYGSRGSNAVLRRVGSSARPTSN